MVLPVTWAVFSEGSGFRKWLFSVGGGGAQIVGNFSTGGVLPGDSRWLGELRCLLHGWRHDVCVGFVWLGCAGLDGWCLAV